VNSSSGEKIDSRQFLSLIHSAGWKETSWRRLLRVPDFIASRGSSLFSGAISTSCGGKPGVDSDKRLFSCNRIGIIRPGVGPWSQGIGLTMLRIWH
jgi:hypothetical protein